MFRCCRLFCGETDGCCNLVGGVAANICCCAFNICCVTAAAAELIAEFAAAAPRPLLLEPLVPRGARAPRVLRPPSPRGEGAPGGRPGPRFPKNNKY